MFPRTSDQETAELYSRLLPAERCVGLVLLVLATNAVGSAERAPPADGVLPWVPSAEGSDYRGDRVHRLLGDIEKDVARVRPWVQRYGYGAVFVAVGVEGFGIPAPGQTVLEVGSAASTSPDARLQIGWILLVAFLAASLGNSLGYLIGRWGGRGLLHRLGIHPRHMDKIEGQFDRYGEWLILFGRFFDGPRQLNGIAAGILAMPWARFTLFNLAGAALWACFWGLGVYYLDLHLDQVVALIRRINPWVAAVSLVGLGAVVVLVWIGSSKRNRTEP